jgi:hypothetical protein
LAERQALAHGARFADILVCISLEQLSGSGVVALVESITVLAGEVVLGAAQDLGDASICKLSKTGLSDGRNRDASFEAAIELDTAPGSIGKSAQTYLQSSFVPMKEEISNAWFRRRVRARPKEGKPR